MTRDDVMTSPRMAGMVRRYHTFPTIQTQTVAEHSWRVAMIYIEIIGNAEAHIYQYILEHDLPELHTGDIPFHVKNRYPEIRDVLKMPEQHAKEALTLNTFLLTPLQKDCIKLCDLLEMFEFGLVERALGSKFAEPIITATKWEASNVAERLDMVETVRAWCDKEERRYA